VSKQKFKQLDGCRFKAAQVQSWLFSSFTYFSNILCVVNVKVLGLKAYWYTGSAFTRYLQSYLNSCVITEKKHALKR